MIARLVVSFSYVLFCIKPIIDTSSDSSSGDGAANGARNGRSTTLQTPNGILLIILAILLVGLGVYPTPLIRLITAVLPLIS